QLRVAVDHPLDQLAGEIRLIALRRVEKFTLRFRTDAELGEELEYPITQRLDRRRVEVARMSAWVLLENALEILGEVREQALELRDAGRPGGKVAVYAQQLDRSRFRRRRRGFRLDRLRQLGDVLLESLRLRSEGVERSHLGRRRRHPRHS